MGKESFRKTVWGIFERKNFNIYFFCKLVIFLISLSVNRPEYDFFIDKCKEKKFHFFIF